VETLKESCSNKIINYKWVEYIMKLIKILGISTLIGSLLTLPANARQILEGDYGQGPVDGGVTVKGKKYQTSGEGITSPWRSTSELKYIKKGVILLPKNVGYGGAYFCLNSMIPNNHNSLPAMCSAKGWVYKK
jgi:hypothetical protein